MKKKVMMLVVALMLVGCGKEAEEPTTNELVSTTVEQKETPEVSKEDKQDSQETVKTTQPKGYVFEYQGVRIGMDMEASPIIAALGEPASYFEAPSCAFEGLDKTYSYGSFEIDTYEQDGRDFISCVFFCDDLIETPEGVALFETKEDMTAAYGESFKEEYGMLVYEKEGMKLRFLVEENEITSIEYVSTVFEIE